MKKEMLLLISIVLTLFADPVAKGEKAPQFSSIDENGYKHSLSDYIGKKRVVLVFYPGDNTPRCTKQLCELRDNYELLMERDSVAILGVNNNTVESHKEFAEAQGYQFPLLIDKNWEIATMYGVDGGIMGVKRWVFIIDKNGDILFAKKGKPPVEELLEALDDEKKN